MTTHGDGGQGTVESVYLCLRGTVRPAAVAYGILARQKDRSTALVEQAEQLLQATREFLSAAGLSHILGDQTQAGTPASHVTAQPNLIADAYVSAGIEWARLTSSAVALGEALIEKFRKDEVSRLADALGEVGETKTATYLRDSLKKAIFGKHNTELAQITERMTEAEITHALAAMRDALLDFRDYQAQSSVLAGYLNPIYQSIKRYEHPRLAQSRPAFYPFRLPQDYGLSDVAQQLGLLSHMFEDAKEVVSHGRRQRSKY